MLKNTMPIIELIILQDLTCQGEYCSVAYRCWDGPLMKCCWPPENQDECEDLKVTCFPAMARLSVANGKSMEMFELQVGDSVQTGRKMDII